MTPKWARWRLKSPAPRLFTQSFIQGADQRKHQSSTSLAFVQRIHRWLMNSLHKGPVTGKMFPFDDVIVRVHAQLRAHAGYKQKLDSSYCIHEGENLESLWCFWRRSKDKKNNQNKTKIALLKKYLLKPDCKKSSANWHKPYPWNINPRSSLDSVPVKIISYLTHWSLNKMAQFPRWNF